MNINVGTRIRITVTDGDDENYFREGDTGIVEDVYYDYCSVKFDEGHEDVLGETSDHTWYAYFNQMEVIA